VAPAFEYPLSLAAMGVLVCCSGFFSSSEASLFVLTRHDRLAFVGGGRSRRMAARLLDAPDRLLTAILFWNLVTNLAYFSLASIVGLQLQARDLSAEAGVFSLVALLSIITLGEMVPKNVAVLVPRVVAPLLAVPLAVLVKVVDPALPIFQGWSLLSKRLLWPQFEAETYLQTDDLERAVQLSTSDAVLADQENTVLRNVLSLSTLRVDELMRPRRHLQVHTPPVMRDDLVGRLPPSGYLLVSEPDSDEVAAGLPLGELSVVPEQHLEFRAPEVVYVPWCASVASALDEMRSRRCQVAAVINEFGETIGVVTYYDIVETVFTARSSRSQRLLKRQPIQQVDAGLWQVSGMMRLRRLGRYFNITLPQSRSVTVAGVIAELLERLPEAGDVCDWGPFHFEVIDVPEVGDLRIGLTRRDGKGGMS
jgi:putative hemolysin